LVHAPEGGAFLLYVAAFVVLFFLDDKASIMHVDDVRRV